VSQPDQATLTPRNRLLRALPYESWVALRPSLSLVDLPFNQILHAAGVRITTIYFPENGFASMIAYLEDSTGAEVGLIGYEGFIGLPVLLGAEFDDIEALVQCSGTAWSMSVKTFLAVLSAHDELRGLLLRYALLHHTQVARSAACNGRHHIEQRLARWLLMGHDRSMEDEFPMTHDFLSMMLGVRRAGVTVAAGALQKAGLISYKPGRVAIADRVGLEKASCECYHIARRASDRLFGAHIGPSSHAD
jgi:CRP-like cAMP-binding protein